MTDMTLTPDQLAVIQQPLDSKTFLRGPAGAGKTAVGLERLKHLLARGVPAENILLLTSQRILQDPYLDTIQSGEAPADGVPLPLTMSGLAWRMVNRFWSLAAPAAGFANPDGQPVFLNLETAQYYMAYVVRPLLEQGYFESLTVDRNRLYVQILENLNRSATVGFPYTEIGARLDTAWSGDPAHRRLFVEAQECATRFREFCLDHNLLDFSLLLEVFASHLWPNPRVQEHLIGTYRHLIYDNVEEDVPRSHDILRAWLPSFESALLIFDEGGGYRSFLGADPFTGRALAELCDQQAVFDSSLVMSPEIARLATDLAEAAAPESNAGLLYAPAPKKSLTIAERPTVLADNGSPISDRDSRLSDHGSLEILASRFYPEMMDSIVENVSGLVNDQGISPSEIVILAPFLPDSLRFAVTSRLEARGLPWRTNRPSRTLRDEPATQVLLTLAALAHPHWMIRPSKFDVARALMLALNVDLIRAQMLAEIVYRAKEFTLSDFDRINDDMRDRLTHEFGRRYTELRDWIVSYREALPLPLDHCLRRLLSEVLAQPGYGFDGNVEASRVAASLIESIRRFRSALEPSLVNLDHPDFDVGREYVDMLLGGVLPALYLESWRSESADAVLVAPAYTFLVMNQPATIQFWLDASSASWYEGLSQPLTNPYVLTREWPAGRQWTFADQEDANLATMRSVMAGLLHRCRSKLYLAISTLGETGFDQRGPMLRAFQRLLQSSNANS